MNLSYREDIDWLRAIAVLSVVAFHFEAPAIFGGFAGVDIFFVISGYLITRAVYSELEAGRFSFAAFYERRMRRLVPALYIMIALTSIPAVHYLLTSERREYFRSIIAVVTFTSNFFFWFQTGYFDHAAVEKPLLHTWSLAVEEQFYLVFPMLLWSLSIVVARRRSVLTVLFAALWLASFTLSIWQMKSDHSPAAFFLSPPRAWEFLTGALLVIPGLPVLRHTLAQHVVRGIALVVIAIPIFGLRQGPGFPGFNALAPTVGAAIFIWSGGGAPTMERSALSPLEIVRFIGRISYSLYLWHWPLFTFARFSQNALVLNGFQKSGLFALTVAISYLSWRFVERPFRRATLVPTTRAAFLITGVVSVVLLVGGVGGNVLFSAPSDVDRDAMQFDVYNAYDYKPAYRSGTCFSPANGILDESCLKLVPGKANLLLWGDSYAAHYFFGLQKAIGSQANILQATQAACMPTLNIVARVTASCANFNAQMVAFFGAHRPDVVVLSADWLEYARPPRFDGMIADLRRTIAGLDEYGISVILLGPAVQFRSSLPSMLTRVHVRNSDVNPSDFVLSDIFVLDEKMKAAIADVDRLSYVSVVDAICPKRKCPLTTADNIPLTWDHAHLTAEGSSFVMAKLVQIMRVGQFSPVRKM